MHRNHIVGNKMSIYLQMFYYKHRISSFVLLLNLKDEDAYFSVFLHKIFYQSNSYPKQNDKHRIYIQVH